MKVKIMIFFSLILFCNNSIYSQYLESTSKNYLVVGNNLNVREKPSTNSKVIYQLKIAERVVVLKRSGIQYRSDSIIGEWVYIDTKHKNSERTSTIKGWVVDFFIAKYNKFKKINSFPDCSIYGTIGDWVMDYEFRKDGRYKQKKGDKYEYGSIYQFRKVLILKSDDSSSLDFFYFDEKDRLCHYFRNREGKSICTKCKMK